MGRRYLIIVIALVAILAALLLFRRQQPTPDLHPVGRSSQADAQRPSRPAHALRQRPALSFMVPADSRRGDTAPAGAFEGRVVSALERKGLPGAQLTFASGQGTSSVTAGDDGAFRFEARTPGRWWLGAVMAPGHQPFAPEWGQSPVQLDARPGEVVRGITIALLPLEEYEGRIVDPDDKPIAGAEVVVLGGGLGATTLVPLRDRYRSNVDGSFRFSAPEDAVVEARQVGFVTSRARVDYAVRVSRKLTIRLEPATTAVSLLSIDGTVEDAKGVPAEGALVSAVPKQGIRETAVTARADANGRFRLNELTAGTWTVTASLRDAAPASMDVEAGATGVRLQLAAGGRVTGRVRDQRTGAPVTVFTVLVLGTEIRGAAVIDAAGGFELDGLTPGQAVISVIAPGYGPSREVRATIPGPGAPPARVDFDLTRGGRLTGAVVERGTGKPIAGALVEIQGTPPSLGIPVRNETMTDDHGQFEIDALSENSSGVFASAPAHHARVIACPTIPDGEMGGPVTIELTPVAPGEDPRLELTGIGVELEKHGDVLRITMVVPTGGAAEVGLGPGDEVLSVDGVSVKPMTMAEAIPLIRGPEGTTVTLVVVRAGDSARANVVVQVPRRLVRT